MKRAPSAPVPAAVRALLRRWRAQRPLRAGSLLITIFGDAIAPRGAAVTLACRSTIWTRKRNASW